MTDQEKQKVEDLISRLELQVGQIFPRDGGNASLIAGMIQISQRTEKRPRAGAPTLKAEKRKQRFDQDFVGKARNAPGSKMVQKASAARLMPTRSDRCSASTWVGSIGTR